MKYLQYITLVLFLVSIVGNFALRFKHKRIVQKRVYTIIKSSALVMKEKYIRLKRSGAFDEIPCENIEKFLYVCLTFDDLKKIKYKRKSLLKKENLIAQMNYLNFEERASDKNLLLFLEEYRKLNEMVINYSIPYKLKFYNFITFFELLIIIFATKLFAKEYCYEFEVMEKRDSGSYINFDVVSQTEPLAA